MATRRYFPGAGRSSANVNATISPGTDVEVLSESFFCFYFAVIKLRKKTNFNNLGGFYGQGSQWRYITTMSHVRKWCSDVGITPMVTHVLRDPGFSARVDKCWAFLNKKSAGANLDWGEIIPKQIDAFFASPLTRLSGSYVAMRADMIPRGFNPYGVYKHISDKVKQHKDFTESINPNKWNPADVWIFSPAAISALSQFVRNQSSSILNDPGYSVGYMNQMNTKIFTLFKLGQLYPVSLKAPSSSTVKVIATNEENPTMKQQLRYINVEFERDNVDVKINFAIDLLKRDGKGPWRIEQANYMEGRMKTKSATVGGFGSGGGSRLEIEITRPRGGARYGSLGTNIQEVVIENTETSGILQLDRIRQQFPDLYRKYGWGSIKGWMGREAYAKELKKYGLGSQQDFVNEIKPYTDALFRALGSNAGAWDPPQTVLSRNPGVVYISKTHSGEIGVAIDKILRNFMKGVVLENLHNIASSQKVQTGAALEQIQRRVSTLGGILKGELERFPPAKADLIWESGFHLVVK